MRTLTAAVIAENMRPAGGIEKSEQDRFWRTGEQSTPGTPLSWDAAPAR